MDQIQAVRTAHKKLNEILSAALDQERREKGVTVVCRRKCSDCCSEPVYADESEAKLALHRFRGLQKKIQKQVRRKIEFAVEKLKASGILEKEEMPDVFSYLDLGIECPFLHDRECLIYSDRPMSCRMHIASGDPQGCRTREGRKEQVYLSVLEVTDSIFKILLTTQNHLLMGMFPLLLADVFGMPSAEWKGRTKVLIERTE